MVARPRPASGSISVRSWDVVARDILSAHQSWRVHSVFQHACNLVNRDGTLLGVVAASAGNGPATLVLSPTPHLLSDGLRPGDSARVDGDRLTIGDRLVLDLAGATLWQPPPILRNVSIDEVLARLSGAQAIGARLAPNEGLAPLLCGVSLVAEASPSPQPPPPCAGEGEQISPSPAHGAVGMQGPHGGMDGGWGEGDASPISHAAAAQLDALTTAIRQQDWPAAFGPARALSGLGPGLTPSGDDLLAGLALGYRAGSGSLPDELSSALRAAVEGRTTDIAVARVQHAVTGRADEAAHRLLSDLVSGSGAELDTAVRDLVAFGHTSGADTLVGLVVGLTLGLRAPAPPPATVTT